MSRLLRLFQTVADTNRDSFNQRPFVGQVDQINQFHPESTQSACWTLEHRPQALLRDTFDLDQLGSARTYVHPRFHPRSLTLTFAHRTRRRERPSPITRTSTAKVVRRSPATPLSPSSSTSSTPYWSSPRASTGRGRHQQPNIAEPHQPPAPSGAETHVFQLNVSLSDEARSSTPSSRTPSPQIQEKHDKESTYSRKMGNIEHHIEFDLNG